MFRAQILPGRWCGSIGPFQWERNGLPGSIPKAQDINSRDTPGLEDQKTVTAEGVKRMNDPNPPRRLAVRECSSR